MQVIYRETPTCQLNPFCRGGLSYSHLARPGKGQAGTDASWQSDRPERVRALARFTALTPSHPSSACEPPTTITAVPVCRVPAQPGSLLVRCAPAQHWPNSGPAAHYVKGPGAPCHSAHLPSCRPEPRIREERHKHQTPSLLALSSKLN